MSGTKKIKRYKIAICSLLFLCGAILCLLISKKAAQTMRSSQPWLGTESDDPNREITLSNIYITECGSGRITFLYENKPYTLKGKTENTYRGIADIQIKNKKIQKIFLKQEYIEGTLLSYTEEQIEVEGYGYIPCAKNRKVYSDYDGTIREISMSDLIVGSSRLQYIAANNEICAVIQKEKTNAQKIQVLLKRQNGDSPFYTQLFLKGTGTWSIDSIVQAPGAVVDLTGYMERNHFQTSTVVCTDGFLFQTDASGTELGNGYEGSFHIRRTTDGCVLVNEISVEDYVRYVLPSEMPESFSAEALKAQAVCARTFAYSQMKNSSYAAYGANVDDSTAFQVYNAAGTKAASDEAVKATEGLVLTSKGELITCYYFSTSPGITEDMEVWQSESPDYIQKKNTTAGAENDLSSAENFTQFIHSRPEGNDQSSPFYRWTAKLDIANASSEDYGKLKTLLVSKRSTSGFVLGLTASYDSGSQLIESENDIRRFMGQYLTEVTLSDGNVRTDFSMLPSACFEISEISGTTITLTGGGFGHNIGMSQYGADAMGRAGKNYAEILALYYTDVELSEVSDGKY